MIDQKHVQVGDKVYYQPAYYHDDEWVNGIIKEIPDHSNTEVRVVFHCNDDWENYKEYTSQLTPVSGLYLGWRD